MSNREGDSPEQALGKAVRALRESGGLSQQWVADRMTERGYSWRQSTAAKTEAGERPVRINEAVALSELFQVDVIALIGAWGEPDADELVSARVQVSGLERLRAQAQDELRDIEQRLQIQRDRLHRVSTALGAQPKD